MVKSFVIYIKSFNDNQLDWNITGVSLPAGAIPIYFEVNHIGAFIIHNNKHMNPENNWGNPNGIKFSQVLKEAHSILGIDD